jgi:sugar/nucleoside kinase (ribokinase family)
MDKVDANGESGWVRVLKRAKSLGIHTNLEMIHLDAESEKALVLPCLPYLSSIIINESEAGALVDIPFKVEGADSDVDWATMELIASKLITLGVSQLAVIHTPAGCVAANSTGKTWRQGSVKVPLSQIKGTSGAGDAFAAGVVYGIHQAWPVQDCLELGVATAAQNIQSDKTAADIAQYETTLSQSRSLGYRNTSK